MNTEDLRTLLADRAATVDVSRPERVAEVHRRIDRHGGRRLLGGSVRGDLHAVVWIAVATVVVVAGAVIAVAYLPGRFGTDPVATPPVGGVGDSPSAMTDSSDPGGPAGIEVWDPSVQEFAEQQRSSAGTLGFPNPGAQPSEPTVGEAVLALGSCQKGPYPGRGLTVFADGRLFWTIPMRYRGDTVRTIAYVTQRLTPDGVELMRSELLASGLLKRGRGQDCEAGDEFEGYLETQQHLADPNNPETLLSFRTSANEVVARLANPASWLPASAWADREMRAFVPSQYCIALWAAGSGVSLESLAGRLAKPAEEIVLGKRWQSQSQEWIAYYTSFPTDDARVVAEAALASPDFEPGRGSDAVHNSDTGRVVYFAPRLPNQTDFDPPC